MSNHFKQAFKSFACEGDTITASIEGFDIKARIVRDDADDKPEERDCGFWPSREKTAAGYVAPENFEAEKAKAERVMKAWENDEWFYCGIVLSVSRHARFGNATIEVDLAPHAAALWGIECNYPDSDNSYLTEVANDLLPEALATAKTIYDSL